MRRTPAGVAEKRVKGMNETMLFCDPGLSTGLVRVCWGDRAPLSVVEGFQIGGGVEGLIDWVRSNSVANVLWGCEKFKPINHANYALTTASVEPLRCEGALIAMDLMPADDKNPRWRHPKDQYVVGGKDLADKKKRLRKFLKDTGNYRMPKELGAPDSDDFVSATGHAFAYAIKELKHKPTFDLVREWVG